MRIGLKSPDIYVLGIFCLLIQFSLSIVLKPSLTQEEITTAQYEMKVMKLLSWEN